MYLKLTSMIDINLFWYGKVHSSLDRLVIGNQKQTPCLVKFRAETMKKIANFTVLFNSILKVLPSTWEE